MFNTSTLTFTYQNILIQPRPSWTWVSTSLYKITFWCCTHAIYGECFNWPKFIIAPYTYLQLVDAFYWTSTCYWNKLLHLSHYMSVKMRLWNRNYSNYGTLYSSHSILSFRTLNIHKDECPGTLFTIGINFHCSEENMALVQMWWEIGVSRFT